MKKFEYKIVGYTPSLEEFTELGLKGWELCEMIESRTEQLGITQINREWIFKREMS